MWCVLLCCVVVFALCGWRAKDPRQACYGLSHALSAGGNGVCSELAVQHKRYAALPLASPYFRSLPTSSYVILTARTVSHPALERYSERGPPATAQLLGPLRRSTRRLARAVATAAVALQSARGLCRRARHTCYSQCWWRVCDAANRSTRLSGGGGSGRRRVARWRAAPRGSGAGGRVPGARCNTDRGTGADSIPTGLATGDPLPADLLAGLMGDDSDDESEMDDASVTGAKRKHDDL